MSAPFTFVLPSELSAKEPPEQRGIRRDQVRLMVIKRTSKKIEHTRFDRIDNYLRPGDLLVFNSSRTRLWRLRFTKSGTELVDFIYRLGKPIRYEYVSAPWDLDYYQTVYAKEPGSAEMPSAGRAFSWKLLLNLKRRGIDTAYLILHTGLSSYMDDELDAQHPASEEEYFVSATAADKINQARGSGGRIIAVGTTVVRALESVVDANGRVSEAHGYTQLKIDNLHQLRAVDGLLTGLHEPQASHLDLLSAFLPPEQIRAAYEEAIARKYLWHEFGDLNLIL
jgi:S-adenosylmethionine:tRNA ribosyltransferase-isomerase